MNDNNKYHNPIYDCTFFTYRWVVSLSTRFICSTWVSIKTISTKNFIIQIKICAEYWDMLPRPRLVCQEPGLRSIGRSSGVPDKSSPGLGSISRYSAQILICFIAYIFPFFIPLWVLLGTLQDYNHAQCPLPLSIVVRMRLVIRQSKLPACLAEVQLAHDKHDELGAVIKFSHFSSHTGTCML